MFFGNYCQFPSFFDSFGLGFTSAFNFNMFSGFNNLFCGSVFNWNNPFMGMNSFPCVYGNNVNIFTPYSVDYNNYSFTANSDVFCSQNNSLPTFGNYDFNPFSSTAFNSSFKTSSTSKSNRSGKVTGSGNYANLSSYNAEKGLKLAKIAYQNMDSAWGQQDCKKHVRQASEKAGLGTISGHNGVGSLPSLRSNPNYKEISVNDIDWQHPPVGTIGIYKPGSQGYSKSDGHTEIFAEVDGKSVGLSSYITNNIKKADYYFIPV